MTGKTLALLLTALLVIGGAAGGTYALLYHTDQVTNTFTSGHISITLTETDADLDGDTNHNSYALQIGATIPKDPTITVAASSEPHWLMVQLTESENFADYLTYTVDPLWTALPGAAGVYYTVIEEKPAADLSLPVLENNQVTVRSDVTNTMLRNLTAETYPTLVVKAYAIQLDGIATAEEAWQAVSGQ